MRIVEPAYERVPIERLAPHPRNPRRGDVAAIAASLKAHGQYRPLVVQRSTGYVLAGNHTLAALRSLGAAEAEVGWVDVDDDQALRIMLADNRTADLATYDQDTLVDLLRELDVLDGQKGTGYEAWDLAALVTAAEWIDRVEPNQPADQSRLDINLGTTRIICPACGHSFAWNERGKIAPIPPATD